MPWENRIPSPESLHEFALAAVTDYYKLSNLTQMYYCRVLEVRRLKQVGKTMFLLGTQGAKLFPCLFQVLEAVCHLWLMVQHHSAICFCYHTCYSYSNSPVFLFRRPLWWHGPTWIFQDTLPISGSLAKSHLQNLLLYEVTVSRFWVSGCGHLWVPVAQSSTDAHPRLHLPGQFCVDQDRQDLST